MAAEFSSCRCRCSLSAANCTVLLVLLLLLLVLLPPLLLPLPPLLLLLPLRACEPRRLNAAVQLQKTIKSSGERHLIITIYAQTD